jgi:carboxypeptidase PM20D1
MFTWLAPEMPLVPRSVFANLWLTEPLVVHSLLGEPASAAMVRTTTAVTIVEGGGKANVLPPRARAVVNHRILPGESQESVLRRVREIVDDPRVGVRLNDDEGSDPSPVSDPDGASFRKLARTIREVLGGDGEIVVAPYLVIGGTDSKYYASSSANVYRFLPAPMGDDDLERMHGRDERLGVDSFLTSVRFYHRLLESFAAS